MYTAFKTANIAQALKNNFTKTDATSPKSIDGNISRTSFTKNENY
jgi:hypothetical protein